MKQRLLLLLVCVGWGMPLFAQNYSHQATVASSGGGYSTTGTYRHFSVVGEQAVGYSADLNYSTQIGFIFVLDGSYAVPWAVTPSTQSHTVLLESTLNPTVNGVALGPSDYIGVFYDSAGTLVPAGVVQWSGENTTLTAYGDDASTTNALEGFAPNEPFQWKVWRGSTNEIYDALATYRPVGGPFTHTEYFAANGISGLASLEGAIFFTLQLPAGWSYLSTPVAPATPGVDTVVYQIRDQITLWKDDQGRTYWPEYGIDQIGDWDITEGYMVKLASAQTLQIRGNTLSPEYTPLHLAAGWHLIPYLRTQPLATADALATLGEIKLVKNLAGQVYWPQFNITDLDTLRPGEAYFLNLTGGDTLTYPSNSYQPGGNRSGGARPGPAVVSAARTTLRHYPALAPTGTNMVLGFPASWAESTLQPGDEVAAYDAQGRVVGATAYAGSGALALTLWGDDPTTEASDGLASAAPFVLKHWQAASGHETVLQGLQWAREQAQEYQPHGIAELVGQESGPALPAGYELAVYPNPSAGALTVALALPEAQTVTLEWVDAQGRTLTVVPGLTFGAGQHTFALDGTRYQPGRYFVRVRTDTFTRTLPVTVLR